MHMALPALKGLAMCEQRLPLSGLKALGSLVTSPVGPVLTRIGDKSPRRWGQFDPNWRQVTSPVGPVPSLGEQSDRPGRPGAHLSQACLRCPNVYWALS